MTLPTPPGSTGQVFRRTASPFHAVKTITESIIECGTPESLLRVLEGKRLLSKIEFAAAVGQCGVFGDKNTLNEVVEKWGTGTMDDPLYRCMVRAYVQCGEMEKARECWGCLGDVEGGDLGAAMMAAAGLGDVKWGDDIWVKAHSLMDLYEGDMEPTELLARHYLACNVRGKAPRAKLDAIFTHLQTKGVQLSPDTLTTLLFAATTPAHLKYLMESFPPSPHQHHHSTYAWQLLHTGAPLATLTLPSTTPRPLRNLSFNCAVVEAALTVLYLSNDPSKINLETVRTALEDARKQGANPEWVGICEEKLSNYY